LTQRATLICLATRASSDFDRDRPNENVEEAAHGVAKPSKNAERRAIAGLARGSSGWVVGHRHTLTTVGTTTQCVDFSSDLCVDVGVAVPLMVKSMSPSPTEQSPITRQAAVVYNPTKVDAEALRAAIDMEDAATGWSGPLWLETSEEDPGGDVTLKAINDKVDLVIAAGGDGTVRAVAEALRGTDIPLALVPSGTGNLLARNLDLKLDDLQHSINTAFAGRDREIDVGVIDIEREDTSHDEFAFVVMAGLGVDAKMASGTNAKLKEHVGWLAYAQSIMKAIRDSDELRIRYQLDGGTRRRIGAHTLLIGNCGSLPANMIILPGAKLDDGRFDLVFLRPKGVVGWLRIWIKVAWENGIVRRSRVGRKVMGDVKEIHALQYETAGRVNASFTRPEQIELDGDPFGNAVAIESWIQPLALKVRIPTTDDQ
jgi:diacylglycerol kinase (ATP)